MEQLEKQQAVNMERFKLRAKELKSTVSKELEEATLDCAGESLVAVRRCGSNFTITTLLKGCGG